MKAHDDHSNGTLIENPTLVKTLFAPLFQNGGLAAALVDDSLRVVDANKSFRAILGMPEEFCLRQYAAEHLPFFHTPGFGEKVEALMAGQGGAFEMSCAIDSPGAHEKQVQVRVLRLGGGESPPALLLLLSDQTGDQTRFQLLEAQVRTLTEKNQKLKQYIDSNLQVENFAYLASHDMKEPLRMIGNFSQLLAKRFGDRLDEEGREYLQFILDGVKNMNQFINDLLEYAHLDKIEHRLQPLEVPNMLLALLNSSLRAEIAEKQAQVQIGELPEKILACKEKVRLLFYHLLSNALKFHKEGEPPVVKISGKDKGKHWEFTVEDNGIGLSEEFYQKVFLIFKRLHPRHAYPGTGIGLAICKKIVAQHGGEIWVESQPGNGATFTFTLLKPATS